MKKYQIKWKKLIKKEIIWFSHFQINKFIIKIGKAKLVISIKVI